MALVSPVVLRPERQMRISSPQLPARIPTSRPEPLASKALILLSAVEKPAALSARPSVENLG